MFHAVNLQTGAGQGLEAAELEKIREHRFDTVRFLVPWGKLNSAGAVLNEAALTVSVLPNCPGLDTVIEWCKQSGLKIILCVYWSESWKPPAWASLTGNNNQMFETLFTYNTAREGFIKLWSDLAARYKNESHVMFELINEPSVSVSMSDSLYKSFVADVVTAIEQTEEHNHLKIVQLLRAGSAYEEVLDRDIQKAHVAWATHRYAPWGNYDPEGQVWVQDHWGTGREYVEWRIRRCAEWIRQTGKPWVNTEFGKQDSAVNWDLYISTVLKLKTNMGIQGWTFHAWDKQNGGFSLIDPEGNVKEQTYSLLEPFLPSTPPPPPQPPPACITAFLLSGVGGSGLLPWIRLLRSSLNPWIVQNYYMVSDWLMKVIP